MTACLYINAPTAMMISDCLALPRRKSTQLYSPSNIECYDGVNGDLAKLVSKFIQVDENTLLSFSGSTINIFDFVDWFPRYWEKRDKNLRPMQALQQLDYELRAVRNGWDCSLLGAAIVSNGDKQNSVAVNTYASLRNV